MNCAGKQFVSFSPAVSDKAAKAMREDVRRWKLHHRNDLDLEKIAQWARPILVGWVNYYGRFSSFGASQGTAHSRSIYRALGTAEIQKTSGTRKASVGLVARGQIPPAESVRPLVHEISGWGNRSRMSSRDSRPVLGGRGGGIPPRYSTTCTPTRASPRHEIRSAGISTFTTDDDHIRALTT